MAMLRMRSPGRHPMGYILEQLFWDMIITLLGSLEGLPEHRPCQTGGMTILKQDAARKNRRARCNNTMLTDAGRISQRCPSEGSVYVFPILRT